MKNDNDSLRFNPQIAALAMPTESGFTKAAEGFSNLGKVFLDAEERQSAQALNALKMEEANQSILAKKNENSIFGETQERARESHLLEKRNKTLDGLKKEIEWKADVKKQTENGFMDQFKQMIPSTQFNDPTTGKFREDYYQTVRKGFEDNGGWTKENIHLFDALADGYRKTDLSNQKDLSDISSKEALTNETKEKTKWVGKKAQADINQSNASATNSYASANKNNVEASLAPTKLSIDRDRETRLQTKEAGVNPNDIVKDRAQRAALFKGEATDIEVNFPGYSSLTANDKVVLRRGVLKTGDVPQILPVEDGDNFADKSATHKIVWNNSAALSAKPATPEPDSPDKGIAIGTVKINASTNQKAQWDGKGWVLIK